MKIKELLAKLMEAHKTQILDELDTACDAQDLCEFFVDPQDLLKFGHWWQENYDPESDMLTSFASWRNHKPKTRKSVTVQKPPEPATPSGTSSAMQAFLRGTRKPPE